MIYLVNFYLVRNDKFGSVAQPTEGTNQVKLPLCEWGPKSFHCLAGRCVPKRLFKRLSKSPTGLSESLESVIRIIHRLLLDH